MTMPASSGAKLKDALAVEPPSVNGPRLQPENGGRWTDALSRLIPSGHGSANDVQYKS